VEVRAATVAVAVEAGTRDLCRRRRWTLPPLQVRCWLTALTTSRSTDKITKC